MSQISLKSISGITSITTPAGVDNRFSLYNFDSTERLVLDHSGNLNISGVSTATNFKTGSSNLHSTGLTVGDSFVHSTGINLGTGVTISNNGNATFSGITTFSDEIKIPDNVKIKVGTHEDIEIYNKGNLSIIANKASGASSNNNPLHIFSHFDITYGSGFSQYFKVGNLVGQESSGGGDTALNLISGGAVQAFFDGTKRFETASTGAVVTGILTATSFSGDGSSLSNLPASAPVGGASTNTVFFENDTTVAVNYQITSGKNAMSAGPIAINAGIAVTVPSGSSWTIV